MPQPWDFVAHFSQSSPGRAGPQRCELLFAQLDLAFFAMTAATNLKRERDCAARLSQANLSASRFGCQVSLVDNEMARLLEIVRQPFD